MSTYNAESNRNGRVILAWIILALQIIGIILLLLGGDRIMALTGARPEPTAAAVLPTAEPPTVAPPTEAAATETAQPEPTAEVVTENRLPSAEEAGVLTPEEITVDSSAVVPSWLASVIEGVQPDASAGTGGVPPHLLLTFADPDSGDMMPVDDEQIDLNQPQLRVVPLAALLSWLEARGDDEAQAALDQLRALIQDQPAAEDASVPVPPILGDANQNFIARVEYEGFMGGNGVGYLTNITGDSVLPVTNESGLNYVFQGITGDGQNYVFMSWPVAAAFLPATAADVSADVANAVESDPAAYFGDLDTTAEAAADTDFRPPLSAMAAMLGSLAIGADQVAAAQTEQVSQPADLTGTIWQWQGFNDPNGTELTVDDPENYELVLWPDGTFSLKADCNVGGGTYEMPGSGSLSLTLGPLTRAMCPPDSLSDDFVQRLGFVRTYTFDNDGNLVLNLFADGGNMVFANGGPVETPEVATGEEQPGAVDAGLTGFALQWPGFTNAAGETITVENPEDYQLILLPDGTFNVKADCNVGRGTYTYDADGNLQLVMGPMTRAVCGPDSQSDAFLAFLGSVNGASVAPDGNVTLTTTEGSTANMVSGGPVSVPVAEMAPDDELIGTVWQWLRFEDTAGENNITVDDPAFYLLVFLPGGSYTIKADCNVGRGGYTREGSSLTLTPGPLTMAMCPEGSLSDDYVRLLLQTATYVFNDDGELVLNLKLDSGNMVFANGGPVEMTAEATEPEAQPDAESGNLTSITLQWPGFTDASGNTVTVENPEDYYLVFNSDGTFNFKADCNVGAGSYIYDEDGSLTLFLGPMTAAACPPDSQSDAFLAFLGGVAGVEVADDGTIIMTTADGSTANLENVAEVAIPEVTQQPQILPTGPVGGNPLNIVWQWTSVTDPNGVTTPVENPENYYLVLLDDSTYAFRADCNNGAGSYTLSGSSLILAPGPITLAACPEGSLSDQFVAYLGAITGYSFDDNGNLVLTLADGTTLLMANGGPFEGVDTGVSGEQPPAANPLGDTSWQWTNFRDAKQDYSVPTTADYVITFNADGTVNVVADCNTGRGTYTVDGSSLTISPLATTLMACPEGSLGDAFLNHLTFAGTFTIQGNTLFIDLMADGGRMTFVAVP